MEKNMVLETSFSDNKFTTETMKYIINKVNAPMRIVCRYYSQVLEKNVSVRQGWLLTEAQTTFLAGVLPMEMPFAVRALMFEWFVVAVKKCKKRGV